MGPTYKATGINLKSMPLGESDRLLTILTQEFGLIRAVAAGSRKHHSKLGGHSTLFVVNSLLIAKGRSLDRITQAEALNSYSALSRDLGKLTAGQYLAELTLLQALSEQPQEELFDVLTQHLTRLEQSPANLVLAHLTHAIYQLLITAGVAPQVDACCVSQVPLIPNLADTSWQAGFSASVGGAITLETLQNLKGAPTGERSQPQSRTVVRELESADSAIAITEPPIARYRSTPWPKIAGFNVQMSALELALLQQLPQPELMPDLVPFGESNSTHGCLNLHNAWLRIERVLREYAQYYFEQPIRSAALMDTCFKSMPSAG
jgi:DNA repair protein RecO (recombination protein O)